MSPARLPSPHPVFPVLPTFAGLLLGALPLASQVYPGVQGEPSYMDVSCLCSSEIPPPGDYLMANDLAYARGEAIETGDGFPTRIEVEDCGGTLRLTSGGRQATLTRQSLGETEVYRGPYTTDDGVRGTMTLVTVEAEGLPFEPAVRFTLRGEARARDVRYPIVLQLQQAAPEAVEACECALMARYYERVAQYRETFADPSLLEEARERGLTISEYQEWLKGLRRDRRDSFDRSLGRTEADEVPTGGGTTTRGGVIHVDDVDMLDRGVPPEMIESAHVHEEVHQQRRLQDERVRTIDDLAAEEVAATEAQLAHIEDWLRANCPRWRPPTRVFD